MAVKRYARELLGLGDEGLGSSPCGKYQTSSTGGEATRLWWTDREGENFALSKHVKNLLHRGMWGDVLDAHSTIQVLRALLVTKPKLGDIAFEVMVELHSSLNYSIDGVLSPGTLQVFGCS